ncbi:hydroxymyristoyl-ACP dehydratase [Lysinibacillus sp. 54212]|uniref:hydroxymyristoyl-ACP dehydratase n=1 Tax=Lysinibacillus sp. 54212 TaxID=3119829 RepID=UPI002FCC2FD8
MRQQSRNIFDNKKELFSPENALNKGFSDSLVQNIHKDILGKNLADDIYQSYFVIFDQRYSKGQVEYILEVLHNQAADIARSKTTYYFFSGLILAMFTFIASIINTRLPIDFSLLQIVALSIISYSLAVWVISYTIDKEYRKVKEVITLVKYYLNFYKQ